MMVELGKIHNRINARFLARNLIDADLNNLGKSLYFANKLSLEFDKFLLEDNLGNLVPVVLSNKYIVEKALDFVHYGLVPPVVGSYMDDRFKGDFSPSSFYNSVERILDKSSEAGDCLGLSSVLEFLLKSRGIETRALLSDNHISIEALVNGEFIPVESTRFDGYGFSYGRRKIGYSNLVSAMLSNSGTARLDAEDWDGSEDFFKQALFFDPKNSHALYNMANTNAAQGDLLESDKNYTKSINFDSGHAESFFRRGIIRIVIGESKKDLSRMEDGIIDLEKYLSFEPKDKCDVENLIGSCKKRLLEYNLV